MIYLVNPRTKKIHRAGWALMWKPKRDNHTFCGQPTDTLIECTGTLVYVAPYKFCITCLRDSGGA